MGRRVAWAVCAGVLAMAGAVAGKDSPMVIAVSPAEEMVGRLLAMPDGERDPQGRRNAERWKLIQDIAAQGDAAIPAILKAASAAVTPLQNTELYGALAGIQTPAGTKELLRLAADKSDSVREAVVEGLIERVEMPEEKGGGQAVFEALVRAAATEPQELVRGRVVAALGRAVAPAEGRAVDGARAAQVVVMLKERLAKDASAGVRFIAACCLSELGDASGLNELKRAALEMAKRKGEDAVVFGGLERLVPALERVTDQKFGPVPMNPMLASDSRKVPELEAGRKAVLEAVVKWVGDHPPAEPPRR